MISVGRLRAPYADDVAHYSKLLARHVRLEQIELREATFANVERVAARLPAGAFVSLLAADGEAFDSPGFARFIEARRASRTRSGLRDRRRVRPRAAGRRAPALVRAR